MKLKYYYCYIILTTIADTILKCLWPKRANLDETGNSRVWAKRDPPPVVNVSETCRQTAEVNTILSVVAMI